MLDSYIILNEKINKFIIIYPFIVLIFLLFTLLLLYNIYIPIYTKDYTEISNYDSKSYIKIPLNKQNYLSNKRNNK